MDWLEFCQKIKRIIPERSRLLDIHYENERIAYKIGDNEYEYTNTQYLELKESCRNIYLVHFL